MWNFISSIVSRNFIYGLVAAVLATIIGIFIHNYNETIRQAALAEYNLKQAQQTLADQKRYIEQLEVLNKKKEDAVITLQNQRDMVEERMKEIEKRISDNPKTSDREASELLKQTIKELETVIP